MAKKRFPDTSRAAYDSLDPTILGERCQKILWALGQMPEGGTSEEISKALKVKDGIVWRRLSDLNRWGFISKNGLKRPLTSGRDAYVWFATKDIQEAEKAIPGKSVADYSKALIQPQISKQVQQQLF